MPLRFCENRVMTEYHAGKPYFTASDDLYPAPCTHSAAPCEDMWRKFDLFMTPPNSPLRENEDPAPQLVPASTDAALTSGIDFDSFDFSFSSASYADDVMDFYSEFVSPSKTPCECSNEQKLIKDCMWNGVGHKASVALRKAHNRTASPTSPSPTHPNGCVDPRNIFPYPVGQPTSGENKKKSLPNLTNSSQKYYRPVADGTETPSDSEEEIDVVTVENTILKPKNGPNTPQKIVATLVPKENGKLAFVTTNGSNVASKGLIKTIAPNGEAQRGRARNKYHVFTTTTTTTSGQAPRVVDMATETRNLKDNSAKSVMAGIKRRHTAEDSTTCCLVAKDSVMQMADPKHVMQRGNSVSPVARFDKKRILSLEGVSFCASTGVRQKDGSKMATIGVKTENTLSTAVEMAFNKNNSKPKIQSSLDLKQESEDDTAGSAMRNLASKSSQNKRKRKAEALARLMSSGSGSDSEQIRAAHNVLERQRREGLRTSFLTLRDNVPELKAMDKTPKVNILNKARDYCLELQKTEKNLMAEKERLNKRNQRLQERLERAKKALHRSYPHDSDIESDIEDSLRGDSPLSSLPPSLPPSPQMYAPSGYYIARRVSTDNTNSPQEVVLRLEAPPTSTKNSKGYPDYSVKPAKCQTEIRAFIASLQKNPDSGNFRGTIPHQEPLSDGFECLDSDEDLLGALC